MERIRPPYECTDDSSQPGTSGAVVAEPGEGVAQDLDAGGVDEGQRGEIDLDGGAWCRGRGDRAGEDWRARQVEFAGQRRSAGVHVEERHLLGREDEVWGGALRCSWV